MRSRSGAASTARSMRRSPRRPKGCAFARASSRRRPRRSREGSVQAVHLVEPFLWRPFGWCRLEVDVAGRVRDRSDAERGKRRLRTLLPVGTRAEAARLLALLVPGAPQPAGRPPRRARWKSPLRYRQLSFAFDERYAVTTGGRLARTASWVPLTKVQSLRRVEGPDAAQASARDRLPRHGRQELRRARFAISTIATRTRPSPVSPSSRARRGAPEPLLRHGEVVRPLPGRLPTGADRSSRGCGRARRDRAAARSRHRHRPARRPACPVCRGGGGRRPRARDAR